MKERIGHAIAAIDSDMLQRAWQEVATSVARSCNECGKNLISELMFATSPSEHISSTCNVRTKLGEFVNPLICFVLLYLF